MDINGLKERMNALTFVNSYSFRYNNVPSDVVPDTIFTVKLYADKNLEKAPLFIVSEPTGEHYHIVQNASENLARIIFKVEDKHIKILRKAGDFIAKKNFQTSLLQELTNHAPILPAKQHLNTVESSMMMLGFVYEGVSYLSELYENHKHSKKLSSLLSDSLFAEHTRHKHGKEFVSLIDYSKTRRDEVINDCTPEAFKSAFGIPVI
jgi:hypothetical protein